MTVPVDLSWSFRSPYCYLALGRVEDVVREFDIDVAVRIVMPLAVRDPDYFEALPKAHGAYNAMDANRIRWCFSPAAIVPPPIQPYIHRLSSLGALATDTGAGMAFIGQVARLLWDGRVRGWDRGRHLAAAGLDIGKLDETIAARPERADSLIAENQKALAAAGHWGVPTLVVDGEPFFGQDRLDVLAWRLDGLGARRPVGQTGPRS